MEVAGRRRGGGEVAGEDDAEEVDLAGDTAMDRNAIEVATLGGGEVLTVEAGGILGQCNDPRNEVSGFVKRRRQRADRSSTVASILERAF
jgi:hypothetical protein